MAFEDGVMASFYDDQILNRRQTKQKGYPVFDEHLMIKIVVPNQTDCVPRPATEADRARFPKSWQAYVDGSQDSEGGFMLKNWAGITAGEVKVCDANNIKTVEQLANVPDSSIHRLGMGGQELKQRAKKFLETNDENGVLRERVSELEARCQELEAKLAAKPTRTRRKVKKKAN